MEENEEFAVLRFLENVNLKVARISADLLEAVKNVGSMTRKECSKALVELKTTLNDLTRWRRDFGSAIFKIEDYLRPLLPDLQMVFMGNLKEALGNASNLKNLLNARMKKLSSAFHGKFGKNVKALVSGFKFVAQEYDVKDPGKVWMDLQYLEGDPTLRENVILGLFNVNNVITKTPFDHSIMKQEPANKLDDQPANEPLLDDQNSEAPMKADVKNVPAVNPTEKQHLRPKGEADDLMCYGKKSQPPERDIDKANILVAMKASNVNDCPLKHKKVDGSKVKIQSWVKLSRIKRNTKLSHLIMKKHPQYRRCLGSNVVLNTEKTFLVRRLLEIHNHYLFHSFKINYARLVVKNDSDDKSKADNCRSKYDRRNYAQMKTDQKLPCDVKPDDPSCFGKKSQPPDVAHDLPKKSNYSSIKLSKKYYGLSGKCLKLSRIRGKLLIIKKKPDCEKRTDGVMNGKRCSVRKWWNGKKARSRMKRLSCKESKYLFCPRKLCL